MIPTMLYQQFKNLVSSLASAPKELAFEAASAALDGRVTILELVISNPGANKVLEKQVQYSPTKTLGGILDNASFDKTLYVPGAMTPTEVLSIFNAGARLIKVYHVSAMGGVRYITALKRVFPQIPLLASQGINLDSVDEYLAEEATAVVLSDAIFNKKNHG